MSAPTCRTCYLASLPDADRQRIAAEPVTSTVYLCPEHQAQMDSLLDRLAPMLVKARKPAEESSDDR